MTILKIGSVCGDDIGEVNVFMDENDTVIGVNSLNDANWRHEYFDYIFASIGVEIVESDLNKDEIVKKAKDFMGF